MNISIIIPTLNEEIYIRSLLIFLGNHQYSAKFEIIVVDGGSTDKTLYSISDIDGVKVIQSDVASRPVQLNIGANAAANDIFYFVHADARPPNSFYEDIRESLKSHKIGGYRCKFDSNHFLLKINAFFTRFPMMWCRGGDQTLFITRSFFEELGGYDERFCVMEDFDLLKRAMEHTAYHVIPKNVLVSSRKYVHNNYLKVQLANLKAFRMFKQGEEPGEIRKYYKETLKLVDY